ncbi:hypothetical protein AB0I10_15475 [Streptomyces sp. NPDC050636]|uniref:hypothetical protein n=1 Tax=Streptomyces sp. NPDC050636 TaxID=3154510 RepID=UPI003416A0B3
MRDMRTLRLPLPVRQADGGDQVPGDALKWPPCRCGSPKCPDREVPTPPPALSPVIGELLARVREVNSRQHRERP